MFVCLFFNLHFKSPHGYSQPTVTNGSTDETDQGQSFNLYYLDTRI